MNRPNQSNKNKTALITGASGGIGEQFARIFARDGYNLVLVARSKDKLEQLGEELRKKHGISVKPIPKDLSVPSSPQEIYDELQRDKIAVDVLVNNAGFALRSPLVEADLDILLQMMQVNIVTLTHLTRLFLPSMIERRFGKILNVSSTAAFQPGPLMAVYYATKSYVLSFSEAIAVELEGKGVSVTALCPGSTRTYFIERSGMGPSRLVQSGHVMSAETVAAAGYRSLMKGQTVVIPGLRNWVLAEAVRFVPRRFAARTAGKAQEISQ
jgi:short-subunit dehydrogenase